MYKAELILQICQTYFMKLKMLDMYIYYLKHISLKMLVVISSWTIMFNCDVTLTVKASYLLLLFVINIILFE